MTTKTIQKDEDLIILGDDSQIDSSILDFNFNIDDANNTTSWPTITFWDDNEATAVVDNGLDLNFLIDDVVSKDTKEVSDSLVSFNSETDVSTVNDLFNLWSVETDSNSLLGISEDGKIQDNIPSFWENIWAFQNINEEKSTHNELVQNTAPLNENILLDNKAQVFDNVEWNVKDSAMSWIVSSNEKIGDRNEILSSTIEKLKQRKESVLQIKQSRQAKVDELNEQISKLKKDISNLQSEINDLQKEEDLIDLDISSIEKMKLNILEDSSEKWRKHNLGNIKKTK